MRVRDRQLAAHKSLLTPLTLTQSRSRLESPLSSSACLSRSAHPYLRVDRRARVTRDSSPAPVPADPSRAESSRVESCRALAREARVKRATSCSLARRLGTRRTPGRSPQRTRQTTGQLRSTLDALPPAFSCCQGTGKQAARAACHIPSLATGRPSADVTTHFLRLRP